MFFYINRFFYLQGYSRKGAALAYLKNHDEALAAYAEGLKLDPNNEQLKEGVKEVQAQLREGKYYFIINLFIFSKSFALNVYRVFY